MNKFLSGAFCLLSLAFFASTAVAQAVTASSLKQDLSGNWLVTLERDAKARMLKIESVTQKSEGVFLAEALYNFSERPLTPVEAEIQQTAQGRTLTIITQASTRIVARQEPDGTFIGTFNPVNGNPQAVKLKKLSEAETQAAQESARKLSSAVIEKPADNVPPACAFFSGKWAGTWPYVLSKYSLWVVSIDDKCNARISYQASDKAPTSFANVEIKDGVMEYKRDNFSIIFKKSGEDLMANYFSVAANNFTYFEKLK